MSVKFKSSRKNFKKKLKSLLPFAAIITALVAVMAILIVPPLISEANNYDEIIFVVGDTANTPRPTLSLPEYAESRYNGKGLYAVSVSKPTKNPIEIESETVNDIKTYLESMSAKADGADYLEAIRTAARFADNPEKTLIYVIGSGLSDRGLLDFANNDLLSEEIEITDITEKIAEKIKDTSELKDLTIVWDNLGETVPPQTELTSTAKNRLKSIYKDVLTAISTDAKGKKSNFELIFKESGAADHSAATSFVVTPVSVEADIIDIHEEHSAASASTFTFQNGSSTDFIDEPATIAIINDHVTKLTAHPNAKITITAYASRGNPCRETPDDALIEARLTTIKRLYQARGIAENRIITKNGGFGSANDCPNGVADDIKASENRKVTIDIK